MENEYEIVGTHDLRLQVNSADGFRHVVLRDADDGDVIVVNEDDVEALRDCLTVELVTRNKAQQKDAAFQGLVKSVVSRFSGDPTAASVVVSWLEDRQLWYASAVRYVERYAGGKYVVANATGESLEEAFGKLTARLEPYLRSSSLKYSFNVVEEYEGTAPEAFGSVVLDSVPAPGDVVMLRWLDGKDAYRVRVERVLLDDLVLRVRKCCEKRD